MKTKYYKTIKGLLLHTAYNSLSLEEFINRKACLKDSNGYMRYTHFKLSAEAQEQILNEWLKIICCRNREEYKNRIKYAHKTYGIYRRLDVRFYNNTLHFGYCAGQDYDWELKTLRECLRNGY